jgi:hypothetical protein
MKLQEQRIGNDRWKTLPGSYGKDFAFYEAYIAGAQDNRLLVWQQDELVAEVYSPGTRSGFPRWAGGVIFWADGWMDPVSGEYNRISAMEQHLTGPAIAIPASMQGRYTPLTYVWSPDAAWVLVSLCWTGGGTPLPPLLRTLNRDGTRRVDLSLVPDSPPQVAWVAKEWIALGTREPAIFNPAGQVERTLTGNLPPRGMEADAKENRLLVHGYDRIAVWDTRDWSLVDILPGSWIDAALAPSGDLLLAVDFDGNIHCAAITGKKIETVKKMIPSDPVTAISISENLVVASFAMGNPVRVTAIGNII